MPIAETPPAAPPAEPVGPIVAEVAMGEPFAVMLNGEGPFRLGVDSAQSVGLLVSPGLARRLGLPIVSEIDASDGVNSIKIPLAVVESARLGDWERTGEAALVMAPAKEGSEGALGLPFFDGLLLEFDGPAGRVRARRGSLPEADGRAVLDLSMETGAPMVELSIAGRRVDAILDTGSEGGLLLPGAMAGELPLEGPPAPAGRMGTLFGEFETSSARLLGTVSLGGAEFTSPVVTFCDYFAEPVLGRGFMKDLVMTFDADRGRVAVARPAK